MAERAANRERWLGLVVVTVCVAALLLPQSLHYEFESPDIVEHMAIANALVHGSGFVDPIQYYYYLEQTAPLPAFAVRAPVVPLLLAAPLALGADLATLHVAHDLWVVLLAALSYWALASFMPFWAAAIAIILLQASGVWLFVSMGPLHEPTAAAVLVGIIVSARRVPESTIAGVICASMILLGWMTRPNLGIMWVAVPAGLVWSMGLREALRSRPLQAFLLWSIVSFLAVRYVHLAATGLTPYQGYGVASQHIEMKGFYAYGAYTESTIEFVRAHASEIAHVALRRLWQVVSASMLGWDHLWLGWSLLAGWALAVVRWRRMPVDQAILVLAGLGFLAVQLLRYLSFEPRYALQMIQCGVISSMLLLGEWLPRRSGRPATRVRAPSVALAVVVGLALSISAARLPQARVLAQNPRPERFVSEYCSSMEPDALVAASYPWALHMHCGHAAILIPRNIARPAARAAFLDERRPAYLAVRRALVDRLPVLPVIAQEDRTVVLRAPTHGPAPTAVWRAPPPPICAGRDECRRPPATSDEPPS